jgi:amino acid adenylation domain-containing protein
MTSFNISPQQKRVWGLSGSPQTFRTRCLLKIEGSLDVGTFEQALRTVIDGSDVLRARYVIDENKIYPTQVVDDEYKFRLNVVKLKDVKNEKDVVRKFFEEDRQTERSELIDYCLLQVSSKLNYFRINAPAFLVDNYSVNLICREAIRFYNAFQSGKTADLPGEQIPYFQYSDWQEENLRIRDAETHFWRDYDTKDFSTIQLPFEMPANPDGPDVIRSSKVDIPASICDELRKNTDDDLIPDVLLTTWALLLGKLSGSSQFLLGVVDNDRDVDVLMNVAGLMSKVLPLKVSLDSSKTSVEVVDSIRNERMLVKEWKDFFLLGWEEDRVNEEQLTSYGFEYNGRALVATESPLKVTVLGQDSQIERFKLKLTVTDFADRITIDVQFNAARFSESDISRISKYYLNLLRVFAKHPGSGIGEMSILDRKELDAVTRGFNRNRIKFDENIKLLDRFFDVVGKSPDRIALTYGDRSTTYRELDQASSKVAAYLVKNMDVKPNDIVAVWLDDPHQAVVSILGILKSGGAYLPLATDLPVQRVKVILNDSRSVCVVSESTHLSKLDIKVRALNVDNVSFDGCPVSFKVDVVNDALAYVIYTSGSTGVPKGVVINRLSLLNLFYGLKHDVYFDSPAEMRVALLASFAFDASVPQIFCSLLDGHTLCLVDQGWKKEASRLSRYLLNVNPQSIDFTPTLLSIMMSLEGDAIATLPLKHVMIGGEKLPLPLVRKFYERMSTSKQVRMSNVYGPTECCVECTVLNITNDDIPHEMTIGKPLPNRTVLILDPDRNPTPIGVSGEIYIAGRLSNGYLNNENLTSQTFVQLGGDFKDTVFYRSGDIGRWTSDGNIFLYGRNDGQVKINGYRVELVEIEKALIQIDGINDARVILNNDTGHDDLVAYVAGGAQFSSEQLRAELLKILPSYMVPAVFVFAAQFPLTSSGKVDFKALPAPSRKGLMHKVAYKAPKDQYESVLVSVFEKELGVTGVGVLNDFFSLGGDSIRAIKVVAAINKSLNTKLRISDIFNHPTVEGIAAYLASNSSSSPDPHTVGLRKIEEFKQAVLDDPKEVAELPEDFEDIYPVTAIESGLIYSSILNPDEPVYYDQFSFQLEIGDVDQLLRAIGILTQHHPILRTVYYLSRFKKPLKVVLKEMRLPITVGDIRNMEVAQQKVHIMNFLSEDLKVRMAFDGEYMWRMRLFRLDEKNYFLTWSFHHAISDGWTTNIFITDLSKLLENGSASLTAHSLKPLKHSYKDYCAFVLGRDMSAEVRDFWKGKLNDYTRNKLPFNYNRAIVSTKKGMLTSRKKFDDSVLAKLKEIAQENSIQLKSVCVTAYLYLLKILCGENDIVAGIVTHDRPAIEDSDRIMGCFLQTFPMRLNFNENKNILNTIRLVESYAREVNPYLIHLTDIARIIGEKSSVENPVFDCIFNYTDFHILNEWKENDTVRNTESALGSTLKITDGGEMTNTLFDLELDKTDESFSARIKYLPAFFEEEKIAYALELYSRILKHFSENITSDFSSIEIVSPAERKVLIEDFNDTYVEMSKTDTLHSLMEEKALQAPGNVAMVQGDTQCSYRELNDKSNQVARYLISNGVKPNDAVAIIIGRSFDMIIAMFGILKAGAQYVPIEPAYPVSRQLYILKNADATAVLTDRQYPVESSPDKPNIPFLRATNATLNLFDDGHVDIKKPVTDLAYTIYTSGSTGNPKGVMITHESAVNLVKWVNKRFSVSVSDRLLFVTSICFDLSVYDIFGMLAAGGSIFIATIEDVQDAAHMSAIIRNNKITFWDSVPSTIGHIVDGLETNETPYVCNSLRLVFMSGDWIPLTLPGRIREYFPNAEVVSLGGATEGTVWSNYFPIKQIESTWSSIPYGKPIDNNSFYILDDELNLVPSGAVGELFIGGAGVAKGYANDHEKASKAFIKDPFIDRWGGVMYKTGDLGRMRADGNMEIIGRKDFQVKIRGFRVELGEIESQLSKHPGVKQAVVAAWKKDNINSLCAYVVAETRLAVNDLKDFLARTLPSYMVPSHFLFVDALPLTSNGKINRKALPEPASDSSAKQAASRPYTYTEKIVAEIWSGILAIPNIGADDDLLNHGAHSLNLSAFINKLHKKVGKLLSIQDVFKDPTIAGIAALVEGSGEGDGSHPTRIPDRRFYDVSHSQRRLWILNQFDENQRAFNLTGSFHFRGSLDIDALNNALTAVVQRHEILRTYFLDYEGEPKQLVSPVEELGLKVEVSDLRFSLNKEALGKAKATEIAKRVFHLDRAPLLRVAVIRLEDDVSIFVLVVHHIIADGWSINILMHELTEAYNSAIEGRSAQFQPLPIQYRDFAHWQNKLLSDPSIAASKTYWLEQLAGELPVLDLATDFQRPPVKTSNGGSIGIRLDPKVSKFITKTGRDHRATVFMTLLSTVNVFLHRYTGQSDIILGTTVAGRNHLFLEDQIGFYVNTLALRSQMNGDQTFETVLAESAKTVLDAQTHQTYPFDKLVEDLSPRKDPSRSPIFDVLIEMVNAGGIEKLALLSKIEANHFHTDTAVSQYDLSFRFSVGDDIMLILEYSTDLFTRERIEKIARHYQNLLASLVDTPAVPIKDLNYMDALEQTVILSKSQPSFVPLDHLNSVVPKFTQQVWRTPKEAAVVFNDVSMTYAELHRLSNHLANHLATSFDVRPGSVVGIFMDRSEYMVISILAIMKTGAAFLPIDHDFPGDRIKYMTDEAKAKVILTDSRNFVHLTSFYTGSLMSLDIELATLAENDGDLPPNTDMDSPAYILYTSGTTGRPKGVVVSLRNLTNYLTWANGYYFHRDVVYNFGFFTSLCFDFTLTSIFCSLLRGGSITIFDEDQDVQNILAEVFKSTSAINAVKLTPSHIGVLSEIDLALTNIQLAIVGGEKIKESHIRTLFGLNPSMEIFNEYGPTETTVGCTIKKIASAKDFESIGKPIQNTFIVILDSNNKLVPEEVVGEICIGGDSVSKGYLDRNDLTREKFIESPYHPGRTIYRTGDLGRWSLSGEIILSGRKDEQVKINGIRIEPGEIESAIGKHPLVREVKIVSKAGENSLIAFYVSDTELSVGDLRKFLGNTLPAFMIPHRFVWMKAFPLTRNAKIDTAAMLRSMKSDDQRKEYVGPRDAIEATVEGIWRTILALDKVSIDENFFEIGGQSLNAVQIVSRLSKELNMKLEVKHVFSHPTIEQLATLIKSMQSAEESVFGDDANTGLETITI